jgi:hypothetical protein
MIYSPDSTACGGDALTQTKGWKNAFEKPGVTQVRSMVTQFTACQLLEVD